MDDTKPEEKPVEEKPVEISEAIMESAKKERYDTVVHFPHMENKTVLDIVNDIKAKKPRRQMAREYDVSCYYLSRILKYFKDCQDAADVKNILDDIYTKNHIVKPINHSANYKKNKDYYRKYSARRYQERKDARKAELDAFHQADQDMLFV